MKKVLFVFNHPAPYKVRVLNELAKSFELTVIFERDKNKDRPKAFYEDLKRDFEQVYIKGIKLGKENFISTGVKKHLKTHKYDLIIMNGYSTIAEMLALSYLKKHNIPYCFYINGGIIKQKETKLKRKIKTYFISGAQAYFSPDEESNKYLVHYGANKEKITNYPYSTIYEKDIATHVLDKSAKERGRTYFCVDTKNVFVSSGQLIKRKNYEGLIKAWVNEPSENGLYIFGEGKERRKLESLIKRYKLSNVSLRGYQSKEDMFRFYSIADAFIFSSKEDIYGHVINEAFSQGLPVISTKNVNSARKLIKNNVNGVLIDSLDELHSSIELVMRKDFTKEALKTSKGNTIEDTVKHHIKAFNEVMSK